MQPGKGKITINGQPFRDYLCRATLATVMQPLMAVDGEKSYDIKINAHGGDTVRLVQFVSVFLVPFRC